jgi:hypothetical protein
LSPLSLGKFAEAFYKKYLKSMYVSGSEQKLEALNSAVNVKVKSDFITVEGNTEFEESLLWGKDWGLNWGFNDNIVKVLYINKIGFRFRVRIESNLIDNDWFIHSFGFEYEQRDGSKAHVIENGALSHIVD